MATGYTTYTHTPWGRNACPRTDLTWMLRHQYAYLPPVQYRDHCQLAPADVQEWLQEQAAVPARVHYEHMWGPDYQPGLGLPLDWFTIDGQRHIGAHRMRNLPTMTVLAECAQHHNIQIHEQCLPCGRRPNMCGPARCRPMNGARPGNACMRG